VRVREIWLGNLPESITKETLYSHFFICGEIEDIELQRHNKSYPYYAFVRFKLSSCAKRAFDMGQSLEIDGMKLKVQFSDYNKRPT
jgi:RNA recognition motif-containing protein